MSEPETLISVDSISKKFCKNFNKSLWYGVHDIYKTVLGSKSSSKLRPHEFWALRTISFEVKRGECFALIGQNGAGKSTLLKMLTGIIRPDEGCITMKGKVGALIELGAGFNPLLSGRDNIYTNALILGFSKDEIDKKFNKILEFSELEEFIDMPVQNYSTGMKVRLGFAVASQMEPDILLIDEVLAVGDAGFRTKCYNEIYRIMKNAAVIFVSHSMNNVSKICTKGLLLQDCLPKVLTSDIQELTISYLSQFTKEKISFEGPGLATVHSISFLEQNESKSFPCDSISIAEISLGYSNEVIISIEAEIEHLIDRFTILFTITDIEQKLVAQISSETFSNIKKRQNLETKISKLLLNTGCYYLSLQLFEHVDQLDRGNIILGVRNLAKISVIRSRFIGVAPIIYNE
jgi:lipopolysaccharide transport system ATP-binding protein